MGRDITGLWILNVLNNDWHDTQAAVQHTFPTLTKAKRQVPQLHLDDGLVMFAFI
jgi:hypothetical protein